MTTCTRHTRCDGGEAANPARGTAVLQAAEDLVPGADPDIARRENIFFFGKVLFSPLSSRRIYEGKTRKIACPESKAKKCTCRWSENPDASGGFAATLLKARLR